LDLILADLPQIIFRQSWGILGKHFVFLGSNFS